MTPLIITELWNRFISWSLRLRGPTVAGREEGGSRRLPQGRGQGHHGADCQARHRYVALELLWRTCPGWNCANVYVVSCSSGRSGGLSRARNSKVAIGKEGQNCSSDEVQRCPSRCLCTGDVAPHESGGIADRGSIWAVDKRDLSSRLVCNSVMVIDLNINLISSI